MREFINTYHSYIKYSDRPSRKLYWLLYENDKIVGVFGLGSAFSRPKPIKDFMIQHNIKFNEMANNIVFCMANNNDRNAGTKLLSLVRRDAILWWYERYQDRLKCFQTFVLPPRKGTIYKADNWIQLGSTTGGMTQSVKTIPKKKYEENKEYYDKLNIEIRQFNNGQIRYLIREFQKTEPKLIFVKINNKKYIDRVLKGIN